MHMTHSDDALRNGFTYAEMDRCTKRCGDRCEPPCWALPDLDSATTSVQVCAECADETSSDDALRRAIEVALNEAAQAAYRALAPVSLDYSDENERILRRAEKEARLTAVTAIRALSPDDILKKVKNDQNLL